MSASEQALWTLEELTAYAAMALAVGYEGQPSGRVRDVPDIRTIRYYTTLGLLDRPAGMRGRTALYQRRHLLQLVAIKRLQARGLTLAEIQQRLLGQTDTSLARVAQMPSSTPTTGPEAHGRRGPSTRGEEAEASPERGNFWTEMPAEAEAKDPEPGASDERAAVTNVVGAPLVEGVLLLLTDCRSLDEHDLSALRAAAAPLLKLLQTRRMIGVSRGPSPRKGDTSA